MYSTARRWRWRAPVYPRAPTREAAPTARPGRARRGGGRSGVLVVPRAGRRYGVSAFRAEGPYLDGRRPSHVEFVDAESDVRRRDFTINGLLHPPPRGRTIDVVGGR